MSGLVDGDRPVVVTAVLREGDRVLLCHRSPTRRWFPDVWDLPGGHVEPGEDAAAALVRELREELGIEIAEPAGHPLAWISTDEVVMGVWLVETWAGAVRNTAPEEHDDLAWVDAGALAGRPLAHPTYLALLTRFLT